MAAREALNHSCLECIEIMLSAVGKQNGDHDLLSLPLESLNCIGGMLKGVDTFKEHPLKISGKVSHERRYICEKRPGLEGHGW